MRIERCAVARGRRWGKVWRCAVALALGLAAAAAAQARARNVVLMLADGAGYNTWLATGMYSGTLGRQFFDQRGWVRLAASTYPLRSGWDVPVSAESALVTVPGLVYDPAKAWDPTPVGFPFHFEGYRWLRRAPDSASTTTALVTGRKTYNGAINVDGSGQPIARTLARLARESGRRVGVVSSVPFSHATPAAVGGAHSPDRSRYCALAVELLTSGLLDLIAGCGNPAFDNNGRAIEEPQRRVHRYVGGRAVWEHLGGAGRTLSEGDVICEEHPEQARPITAEEVRELESWTLVQDRAEIEALRSGPTPGRVLIVPRVGQVEFFDGVAADPARPHQVGLGGTLQQSRGSRADPRYTPPGYDPPIPGVPSLETLASAALNALDDDPDGFFLHVEAGAVDWAMHGNQMGRMIEEMLEFERAIQAVIEWIEANGGWDQTLLIVTGDHDHMLWGPRAHELAFHPLQDRGTGKLPGYRWLSDSHSSALVPLFAQGAGAEDLIERATRSDPFRGRYLDQTDVFETMRIALEPER